MVTTFWHFKVSCPTIRDRIMVYYLIIAGFFFRNMLDCTKLLKTEVAWLTQAGGEQGRLGVKTSSPGIASGLLQLTNSVAMEKPFLVCFGPWLWWERFVPPAPGCSSSTLGTEHSWSQNFKAALKKTYHSCLIFFFHFFNVALKC